MKTQREKKQILRLLTPEQIRTLLVIGKGHPFEAPLLLGLVLGLRVGELLALQWQAINWQDGFLLVHLTTHYSQSPLALPSFHPTKYPRIVPLPQAVITCLREHAACQQQERVAAGERWQPLDLVICTEQGHQLFPNDLTPIVQDLMCWACLPVLRFHELRQTTIHQLLRSGLAPEIVGAILGVGVLRPGRHDQLVPFSRAHYEGVRQAMQKFFFGS